MVGQRRSKLIGPAPRTKTSRKPPMIARFAFLVEARHESSEIRALAAGFVRR
jgi:hypothetical protein